jgi:hypothetical protein
MSAGPFTLARFDFACATGDGSNHFAVAMVEAWNISEVFDSLPAEMRADAQVTEVAKYFPEEIRERDWATTI